MVNFIYLFLLSLLILIGVVPFGEAIICYHCDSIADSNATCAMSLGEVDDLPYIECSRELTCVMSIIDSITYRGCGGGNTPTYGATYTKTCNSNLCNGNVYPPGRLKCHHCSAEEGGDDCIEQPKGKPHPCRYHHEEDECYIDVVNATSAYRGCASDKNHTAATNAKRCDYNGCNDDKAAYTLHCAQCDSNNGRGCKMDLFLINTSVCNITLYDECQVDSLLTQPQSCFTYRHLGRVVRGCSDRIPKDIVDDAEHRTECSSSDFCNARCTTQQKCLSCDSTSNEVCRSNASSLTVSTCASPEASSCYACEYTDWSVRRGCGSPDYSTPSNINRCYECDADSGCNGKNFTRCYKCNTEQIGDSCANWELSPGAGIDIEECEDMGSPCISLLYDNGTTVRGCRSIDFNCDSADVFACRSCEGSFCNSGQFPHDRMWCHQCVGCDTVATLADATPCPSDSSATGCLQFYDIYEDQFVRGCQTPELLYQSFFRARSSLYCYTHGCNSNTSTEFHLHFTNLRSSSSTSNSNHLILTLAIIIIQSVIQLYCL